MLKRREKEKGLVKGFSLSLSCHLHTKEGSSFDPHRSNQGTYQLLTNGKVAPYDIPYILPSFQPNRADVDFPIELVPGRFI
jgi:hypothetical protein